MFSPTRTESSDPILEKAALVAELYYVYKLNQKEIAKQLGISRPWVSKLLKRAEEEGMISIKIETPWAGVSSLEKAMLEQFSLQKVKVIQSSPSMRQTAIDCARATAHYLVSTMKQDDIVAFSWGRTLAHVANEFVTVDFPEVTLVPLIGGMGKDTAILSNYIVDTLSNKIHSHYHLLHLPAFVAGLEEKNVLLKDPFVKQIINYGEEADLVVGSIGTLENSTMVKSGYITDQEREELKELGAVGDIALQFIDCNGQPLHHAIQERMVSGDFIKTRTHVRQSIIVALGKEKAPVITAALKGHWIDVLITDSKTAQDILDA